MKTRIMLGALIIAALIGSSVGVGYAGSGGAGTAGGVAFFRCYEIQNGADSPLQLSVDDGFTDSPQVVSVGNVRLLCTPATGHKVKGQYAFVEPTLVDQ